MANTTTQPRLAALSQVDEQTTNSKCRILSSPTLEHEGVGESVSAQL
jgi:hypothetical protein